MRRNQEKNGLTIEENIELKEVMPSYRSVIAYLLQAIMVILVCLSVLYCFLSGMQIEMNPFGLNIRVIIYTAILFVLFLYKPYIKYTLPIVLILYILVGFMNLEDLQIGFTRAANSVIELYNSYFRQTVEPIYYDAINSFQGDNFFIYYSSFLLTGFLCYIVLYGKNLLTYTIVTVPLVFSPLVLGFVPSFIPYLVYVAGTLGIFGALISEKHGRTRFQVKKHVQSDPVVRVSLSKVAIQYITVVIVLLIAMFTYSLYSPDTYEQEFQAEEIRMDVKQKFDTLMSGDLLKDTVFGDIFRSKASGGGLNKGTLNKTGEIKFTHETALKVTTIRDNMKSANYLRGYVGEQYSSRRWTPLAKEDQERLTKLEEGFIIAKNGESLTSALVNLLSNSPYRLNNYNTKGLQVENVHANTSVSYTPYNTFENLNIQDGSIKTNDSSYNFIDFFDRTSTGSPISEKYRNTNIMNILKLNLINSKIYENYFRTTMNKDWLQNIDPDTEEALGDLLQGLTRDTSGDVQDDLKIHVSNVFSGITDIDYLLPLYLDQEDYVLSFGDLITDMNQYSIEENAYFNFVREAYTKLPEEGLERVKQLVAGHEVEIEPTVLNGRPYTGIEQLGGIESVEQTYNSKLRPEEVGYLYLINDNEDSIQSKYYEAIEYVRNYLAQNTSYSLKPGQAPSDEDYVEYFLFTNKKGFCVHYATAATVMLRAMGVPARYAEGYVVTQNDYMKANVIGKQEYLSNISGFGQEVLSGEKVEMEIEDTNAHAWVEVYLPGLGWQPIEMTAPYIYDSVVEIPPVNGDPEATLKPTPKPSATVKPSITPTATPKQTVKPTPKVSGKATSAPNASDGGAGLLGGLKSWYNKLGATGRSLIYISLLLVLLLILVVLTMYLRYFIGSIIRDRKRSLYSDNQWVLYENRRFNKVLDHYKMVYDTKEPYEVFVARLKEKFSFMEESQVLAYYDILLKARFGQEEITKEEARLCDTFLDAYTIGLCQSVGKFKGWLYKKIWIL